MLTELYIFTHAIFLFIFLPHDSIGPWDIPPRISWEVHIHQEQLFSPSVKQLSRSQTFTLLWFISRLSCNSFPFLSNSTFKCLHQSVSFL